MRPICDMDLQYDSLICSVLYLTLYEPFACYMAQIRSGLFSMPPVGESCKF